MFKTIIHIVIYITIGKAIAFSQNTIQYEWDASKRFIEKIHFYKQSDCTNTFDIRTNNPYKDLDAKAIGTNYAEFSLFDLSNSNIPANYFSNALEQENNNTLAIATSDMNLYEEGKNFTAVAYNLYASDSKKDVVGIRGSCYVLNAQGQTTTFYDHIDVDIRFPIVTENGKYFGFLYGGVVSEDGKKVHNNGVRIYNNETNSIIADLKAETSETFMIPIVISNQFIRVESTVRSLVSQSKQLHYKFQIVDMTNKVIYEKIIDKKKRNKLHSITDQYLSFKTENGTIEKLFFEKDFTRKLL